MNITLFLPEELIKEIDIYLQDHYHWHTRETFLEELITSTWEQKEQISKIFAYLNHT